MAQANRELDVSRSAAYRLIHPVLQADGLNMSAALAGPRRRFKNEPDELLPGGRPARQQLTSQRVMPSARPKGERLALRRARN